MMNENKILATVNGKEITENDVNFLIRSMEPQRAMQLNNEEGRKYVLEDLVNQELFYLEALQEGLDQEEAFKIEVDRMKSSLLKQYAINRLLSNIVVAESEIEDYYNQNKEMFVAPESVSASHILVDSKENAEKIIMEISEGLSFEEAASKYSTCPSKANGGELGYFTRGSMVPEFEEAAFNMQKGSISEPVQTQFGYHIIKLTDRKEAGIRDFNEIKDELKQKLTNDKQREVYFNKVNELKKRYEVIMK